MTTAPDDGWVAGDAYDAYMGRWSRGLARRFVAWLQPPASASWLELGCGTGALTSAICELCEPASIVACDASSAFIEHARAHLADTRVTFVAGDATTLPRASGGYDAAVSGLVLNFLPDPELALRSIGERMKPEGIVGAYVWDYAGGMEFLRLFWEAAAALDPGATAFDERTRFPLCDPDALVSAFRVAGLAGVETCALEVPTDFSSFDDYWMPFLRGSGPAPSYVASLDTRGREVLRHRLEQTLPVQADGHIPLRARAWAARARAAQARAA